GDGDEALAVLGDVLRRAALVGDMLCDVDGVHHVDGVPRAPALAQRAADAALEVDVHEPLDRGLVLAGHLVDAVDGPDLDAGLAPGAVIGPYDGQLLGEFLACLTRALGHGLFLLCLRYPSP